MTRKTTFEFRSEEYANARILIEYPTNTIEDMSQVMVDDNAIEKLLEIIKDKGWGTCGWYLDDVYEEENDE